MIGLPLFDLMGTKQTTRLHESWLKDIRELVLSTHSFLHTFTFIGGCKIQRNAVPLAMIIQVVTSQTFDIVLCDEG